MPPEVLSTRDALRRRLAQIRAAGQTVGLVPTMGALHAGHLSLVEAARAECDFTLVTIFVNPTQFGPHEDFSRYPRTLEADLELLGKCGASCVFAPPQDEMYRTGEQTFVEVPALNDLLEGHFRPGHFRGVATIVLKLFNLTQPDVAFFGRKDYQQSLVVRRMADDLDLPLQIRVCPTVRDADGLALSSRNRYLSPDERRRALAIPHSLKLAAEMVQAGTRDARTIAGAMRVLLERALLAVDYVTLADPHTLASVETVEGPAVALIAARVGQTRLIDNGPIG